MNKSDESVTAIQLKLKQTSAVINSVGYTCALPTVMSESLRLNGQFLTDCFKIKSHGVPKSAPDENHYL